MEQNPAVRLSLFDSHVAVRAGLRVMFTGMPVEIAAETSSRDELLERAAAEPPGSVYLLGFSAAPLEECVSLIGAVLDQDGDARILVYAGYEAHEVVSEVYEAGALGFISTASDAETLRDGLLKIAAGEHYFMPGMAQQIALYHTTGITNQHPRTHLSTDELELFVLLAQKMPVADIAKKLSVSDKSVRNRAVTIRHKLGIPRPSFTNHARFHKLI